MAKKSAVKSRSISKLPRMCGKKYKHFLLHYISLPYSGKTVTTQMAYWH
jgi:hypothetical protein